MKQSYKSIVAAMIGNALEYYDVMLYGSFATMLAPLFFPTDNPSLTALSSLGTFAAGFIMRPLGGLLFGHMGDKIGRRPTLGLTIFLVTIPTFTIGILPSYEKIGLAAPFILVLCRLLQGLCVGGEYSGASIFVVEHSKKGQEAFASSTLCAAGFFGGAIGTFLGFICTQPFMPMWGWRIPFLIGAVIGLLGFYLRRNVSESPDFIRTKKKKVITVPLISVLQTRKKNLFCTIGIGATSLIPFYMASVYMGYLLSVKLDLSTSHIMLINVGLNLFIMGLLPVMGLLADRIGKERLMIWSSCLSIVLAYPLFVFLDQELTVTRIIFVQGILGMITSSFGAPSSAFIVRLFPVQKRYTGVGFGYALGGALLGGTTPLILETLSTWINASLAHTFYLAMSGIIGLTCVLVAHSEQASLFKVKAAY